MNEKRLLFWLTDIDDAFVLEAVERFAALRRKPRRHFSRLLVLAAAIVAMLAVAAVAYGVSYIHKQDEQQVVAVKQEIMENYILEVGEAFSEYEFHWELRSASRSDQTLQEAFFAMVFEDAAAMERMIAYSPKFRSNEVLVFGGMNWHDASSHTVYFALEMVLAENVRVGSVYTLELWGTDPEAVCIGSVKVPVTVYRDESVEFGDSLPVCWGDGTAYIRRAVVRERNVTWYVELPEVLSGECDWKDPVLGVRVEKLRRQLLRSALFYENGDYIALNVEQDPGPYAGRQELRLYCHYDETTAPIGLSEISGVAVGDTLFPVGDGEPLPAPSYEIYRPVNTEPVDMQDVSLTVLETKEQDGFLMVRLHLSPYDKLTGYYNMCFRMGDACGHVLPTGDYASGSISEDGFLVDGVADLTVIFPRYPDTALLTVEEAIPGQEPIILATAVIF